MSGLIEIMTADLSGKALDWATGMVEGIGVMRSSAGEVLYPNRELGDYDLWSPSVNWSQGGPLIDRYRIEIEDRDGICFDALVAIEAGCLVGAGCGDTHLVAACRAIVAAKIGPSIFVPRGIAT